MATNPWLNLTPSKPTTPTAVAKPSVSSSNPWLNLSAPTPKVAPHTAPLGATRINNPSGNETYRTPSGGSIEYLPNGNKIATLPGHLGGGAYNIDSTNEGKIVNTGHTTYGGVPEQVGKNRDDIMPVSLGGVNTDPNNIRVVDANKNPAELETKLAADVKSGKLTLGQARLQILTAKQQREGTTPTKAQTESPSLFNFLEPVSGLKGNLPQSTAESFTHNPYVGFGTGAIIDTANNMSQEDWQNFQNTTANEWLKFTGQSTKQVAQGFASALIQPIAQGRALVTSGKNTSITIPGIGKSEAYSNQVSRDVESGMPLWLAIANQVPNVIFNVLFTAGLAQKAISPSESTVLTSRNTLTPEETAQGKLPGEVTPPVRSFRLTKPSAKPAYIPITDQTPDGQFVRNNLTEQGKYDPKNQLYLKVEPSPDGSGVNGKIVQIKPGLFPKVARLLNARLSFGSASSADAADVAKGEDVIQQGKIGPNEAQQILPNSEPYKVINPAGASDHPLNFTQPKVPYLPTPTTPSEHPLAFNKDVPANYSQPTHNLPQEIAQNPQHPLNFASKTPVSATAGNVPNQPVNIPSAEEAKKYKSAEEFINAQPTYFHVTTADKAASIEANGFKQNKPQLYGGISLTELSNKAASDKFLKSGRFGDTQMQVSVSGKIKDLVAPGETTFGNSDVIRVLKEMGIFNKERHIFGPERLGAGGATKEAQIDLFNALRQEGYVGARIATDETEIWDANAIKTKSQLTDIYNQAQLESNPQAGFVSPGAITGQVVEAAKSTVNFIDQTQKATAAADSFERGMANVQGQNEAMSIRMGQLLKNTPISKADEEALFFHNEKEPSVTITPAQQRLQEEHIAPLKAKIDEAKKEYTKLTGNTFPEIENYVQRIARGRGGAYDRLLAGFTNIVRMGGLLGKSADFLKHRIYHTLVDRQGNRQVVAIKGDEVTGMTNKVAHSMGKIKPLVTSPQEFYDKIVWNALVKLAESLGISHERVMKIKEERSALGISYGDKSAVKTKFATPERVLIHEIGHQIDKQYDLQRIFVNDPATKVELRNLADLRFEGQPVIPSFEKYVRKGAEKMAVMFEAYLHAPQRFQAVAPNTYRKFTDFLAKHSELNPILTIKPSLVYGSNKITTGDVPGTFKDNTGKSWRITDGRTKEIEQHTNTQFYHTIYANMLTQYLRLTQINNAARFIESFKTSEAFKKFAVKENTIGTGTPPVPMPPKNWRVTQLPQFRGYLVEPKMAEAFDRFMSRGGTDVVTKVALYLRTLILTNPLLHLPNVIPNWGIIHTAMFGAPVTPRFARTMGKAITAVYQQNEDFLNLMEHGAFTHGNNELGKLITERLQSEVDKTDVYVKIVHYVKLANPAELINQASKLTWFVDHILKAQLVFEAMEQNSKLTVDQAIDKIDRYYPNYRVSVNTPGYEFLTDPRIFVFSAYHLNLLRGYKNILVDIIKPGSKPLQPSALPGSGEEGGTPPPEEPAESNNQIRWRGIMLLLTTAMAVIAYREMNKHLRKSGLKLPGGGLAALPNTIMDVKEGSTHPIVGLESVLTPNPLVTTVGGVAFNEKYPGTSQPVTTANLADNPAKWTLDVLSYAVTSALNPVQQYITATNGKLTPTQAVLQFFRLNAPKTGKATKILQSQVYGERQGTLTQVKQYIVDGKNVKALATIKEFNNRLLQNIKDTYIEAGMKVPSDAAIEKAFHGQFLTIPSQKSINTFKANKSKSPLQKLLP